MKDANSRKRRRRRSCYDRLRMRMLERPRARRSNPGQSAALQLLALFSFVLRGAPSPTLQPLRYTPPPMSPQHARRLELSRQLDVAPRYVDVVLSQGLVSYARLFDDIRRGGVFSRDAISELRKRAPEASVDWLRHVERWNLWTELLKCHVVHGFEEDTNVLILKAALAWLDAKAGCGEKLEPTASLAIGTGSSP
ncbi:hypothetical protein [Pararhizobium sp. DWP3-4]|uniref:hypothetical protein n=1 Tax=Pararhizobium sp. DWP3-4 TaxID=2804565 RepID=UPI003CF72449